MTGHNSDPPARADTRRQQNPPELVAEFDSFSDFLQRCGRSLTNDGVRVVASGTAQVGSTVGFELRIRDGFRLLRGEAAVLEIAPSQGMNGLRSQATLRFLRLDEPSRRLLPKLVDHFERRAPESPDSGAPTVRETPAPPVGLTLADLEAEFRTETLEAAETAQAGEAPVAEPAKGPVLIEAEALGTVGPPAAAGGVSEVEDVEADEIRFEDLRPRSTELETEDQEEPGAAASAAEADEAEDLGLPWLPRDDRPRRRRDFWVVILLAVLGALLGVAFYYFFMRGSGPAGEGEPPAERASTPQLAEPTASPPVAANGSALQTEPAAAEIAAGALTQRVDEAMPEAGVLIPPESSGEAESPTAAAPQTVAISELDAAATRPLTGVDRITWSELEGETVVVLWADGMFRQAQIDDFRVGVDPPREVVKILGVSRPCPDQSLDLDTSHVRRVRTGLHGGPGASELHVVADLVDAEVRLVRAETSGSQLRVYFSRS